MRKMAALLLLFFPAEMFPQQTPKAIPWAAGHPFCKTIFVNGMPVEDYDDGKIIIDVMAPQWPDKHYFAVTIGVGDRSQQSIDLDPKQFVVQLNDKTVAYPAQMDEEIDKREAHARRTAAIGAALSGFGNGMSQQTGTVHNADGSTSTVTMNQAPNSVTVPGPATNSGFEDARSRLLRHNTLRPDQYLSGVVYFKTPKAKHPSIAYIGLKLDGQIYIFPAPHQR